MSCGRSVTRADERRYAYSDKRADLHGQGAQLSADVADWRTNDGMRRTTRVMGTSGASRVYALTVNRR